MASALPAETHVGVCCVELVGYPRARCFVCGGAGVYDLTVISRRVHACRAHLAAGVDAIAKGLALVPQPPG